MFYKILCNPYSMNCVLTHVNVVSIISCESFIKSDDQRGVVKSTDSADAFTSLLASNSGHVTIHLRGYKRAISHTQLIA